MTDTRKRRMKKVRRPIEAVRIPRLPDPRLIERPKLKRPFAGTIGVVMFEGMEDLDFAGPWEVLKAATRMAGKGTVVSIAEHDAPIRTAMGLRVLADHSFATAPTLNLVLVPGGGGVSSVSPAFVSWLQTVGANCQWVTSVCTGAFLLQRAGFLSGKRATTYWSAIPRLRALGVTTLDDVRFVRDGKVVTSAGVSAGIDMALWLTGQLYTPDFARDVQKYIEYYPAPPYTWEG